MHLGIPFMYGFIIIYTVYTAVSLFFVSKIIHVYLFRNILFLFFSILTKIFEHGLFFSFVNQRRCTRKHTICLISYFSGLVSSLLLSNRPVATSKMLEF